MVIVSLRREKIISWRVPRVSSIYKIEILTDSNTYNVTSYCIKGSCNPAINPSVGKFELTLANPNDKYTDVFSTGDLVKFFKDYSEEATNHRYTGVTESIDKSNNEIKIKGKMLGSSLLDITITGNYPNWEISAILKDVISQVNSQITTPFTTTNVNTTNTYIDISFNGKNANECIEELCQRAGFDFYVDKDKDCHFFEEKSVENTIDAVVHGVNMLELKGFSEDVEQVKNHIIVNGAVVDGIPLVYTTEDATSIASYGYKEEIISDNTLESYDELKNKGDPQLALKKDPPIVGEVKSTLLVGLNLGEMLRVSAPSAGIPPDTYKVVEFEDKFGSNEIPSTKIKLEKWKPSISNEIRKSFLKQKETQDITNINKLEHTYMFTFDDYTNIDDANSSDYAVSEGYLIFSSSSGKMQTDAYETSANISKFEVRAYGENLVGNVTYEVSVDNGVTWQTVDLNTLTTATSDGNKLKIRVTVSDASVKISTLACLYSL